MYLLVLAIQCKHDEAVAMIVISVGFCISFSDNLSSAICHLHKKFMNSDDNPMCIEVRRDYILIDGLKEVRKKKFDPKRQLKVKYKFQQCYS